MKIYIIQGPQGCGKSYLSRKITYNSNFVEISNPINRFTNIGDLIKQNLSSGEKVEFMVFEEGAKDRDCLIGFLHHTVKTEYVNVRFPYSFEQEKIKIPDIIIQLQFSIDTDIFRKTGYEIIDIKFWK